MELMSESEDLWPGPPDQRLGTFWDDYLLIPSTLKPLYGSVLDTARIVENDPIETTFLVPIPEEPVDNAYGGGVTRSKPSRRRDKPSKQQEEPPKQQDKPSKGVEELLWHCKVCDRSYTRRGNLRNHERTKHGIRFPGDKAKHSQKEGRCFLAKAQDDRMTKSMQSNPHEVSLHETSPLHISKDDSGGTPVTVSLIHRLESCLAELSFQSTKGFRIPLVIKIEGFTTNINIDVYDKSQTLPTDSGTTRFRRFLGDFKQSEPELRPEQPQPPPPSSRRQVLKVRRRRASLAMDHDSPDAVMDQQPITTIEAPEIMSDLQSSLVLSPFEDLAHSSSKDETKLTGHRKSDNFHELMKVEPSEIKEEVSSIEAAFSKKRKNPDDDASHYSGSLVDSSEEGDDSDGECDDITTWNCSQRDALPSFLPYIRAHDADTSSPCGDSPDSGSTTSGTTSTTPASSASGLTGGNGLQANGYTSLSAGIRASNNSNNPVLGTKDGMGPDLDSDPQPLPLVCWYSAAGIVCTAKYVKMSTEVRHLWK
ncbi:hypothetical protein AG0111_0g12885 [Alternaria gaisen]|uniref:Uncharacterized protein n=1 Tax=Alternaria gaisen TaxID=167740 RepID=A0ACB6F361_9PLEO|nr:hypothetical protein AG0111_0g12885 [Alternaria gaisen]